MNRYAPFHSAKEGDTTFLNDRSNISAPKKLLDCKASKIYVYEHVYQDIAGDPCPYPDELLIRLVSSSNPRLDFIKELTDHKTRIQAKDYYEDKSIAGIPIGPDTHMYYTNVGANCTIGSHTTIGLPALATERDENDKIYRFPHIGRVILGKNVWIGSQTNISRGSLDDTTIGDNVTIDCHVHIAHNVHVGENTLITAGSTIGGSVTIGNDCWIGLGSTISDHVVIGNNVLVAAGATVVKDVEDKDIVGGVPARSIKSKCNLPDHKLYQMVGYHYHHHHTPGNT